MLCVLLLPLTAAAQEPGPDRILLGGRIFTGDSTRPWADALAIRGERIMAVGTNGEVERLKTSATRVVNLAGRTVIPGLNDAHVHLSLGWPGEESVVSPDPTPDPGRQAVADSLRVAVARVPVGTWLRVSIGGTILDDGLARRRWLDSIAPDHPVILSAWSGHGSIMNGAALRKLAIAEDAADPLGGWYERGADGSLTGLAHEYAQYSLDPWRTQPMPAAEQERSIREQLAQAAGLGLTALQVMEATDPAVSARVFAAADLPARIRLISFVQTTFRGRQLGDAVPPGRNARVGPLARVSGIKYILDGTPIERLALMRRPYADRADWYGRANFPVDTVRALLSEGLRSGEQVMLHAVGDSTIALVLRLMTELAPDSAWRKHRLRLEHADGLTPDLAATARRLGVIVVQNPSHLMIGQLVSARYGAEISSTIQPMRSLLSAGVPLALGSDGPMNPFLNIMFAVLFPGRPSEALTVEQAVRAYTSGSAFAEGMERERGTLAAGMLADLAVLSQDIFAVPVPALPGTTSVLTLVGGRVTHNSGVIAW